VLDKQKQLKKKQRLNLLEVLKQLHPAILQLQSMQSKMKKKTMKKL